MYYFTNTNVTYYADVLLILEAAHVNALEALAAAQHQYQQQL